MNSPRVLLLVREALKCVLELEVELEVTRRRGADNDSDSDTDKHYYRDDYKGHYSSSHAWVKYK